MATRYTVVGGAGGGPFRHDSGGVLTRLVVWTTCECVSRMTFVFSDGTSRTIGDKIERGSTRELTLAEGERITRLVMWKGPYMDHPDYHHAVLLTRIEITTSRGKRFAAGATYDKSVECVVDVASGVVVGVVGRNGWMVDSLGLIFREYADPVPEQPDSRAQRVPRPQRARVSVSDNAEVQSRITVEADNVEHVPDQPDTSAIPPQASILDNAEVQAADMLEAADMALSVVERLKAITLQDEAQYRVDALALEYCDLLVEFSGKKTVFRLVSSRAFMRRVIQFHEYIDDLLRKYGTDEEVSTWREHVEDHRDAQLTAFEAIIENRASLLGDIHYDPQAQTQALAQLLFEFNNVNSRYTEKEIGVLNKALTQLSKLSKNKTPTTISSWFLPPYELTYEEKSFASGSYGTVHHGEYAGCHIAVKRMEISSERDRAAFVKEANAWYRANQNPFVVRLYGAYHLGSNPYFVSEYAANGTLDDFLYNEENRHETWKLLHDAANGLRALHQHEILHNDLKCNNILVSGDCVAKLTDFGLSAQLFALQSRTIRAPAGAYAWKAPEVLSATGATSKASDIYSFAMCIYEAVTRMPPWSGVAEVVVVQNVREGLLPRRLDGVFTDEQWELMVKMTALNPGERLSMDEVVDRLRGFRENEFNDHFAQAP